MTLCRAKRGAMVSDMKPRQTTASLGSRLDPPTTHLPTVMTFEEAARLANASPQALWEAIRAGKISFTLVSGRGDAGILLNRDDLIRVGLLKGSLPTPNAMNEPVPAHARIPSPVATKSKVGFSTIRFGAYTGTAIAGALALLMMVLLLPSLSSGRSSETAAIGLSRSRDPMCASDPAKKGCGNGSSTRSRDSGGARRGSSSGPAAVWPSLPRGTSGAGTSAGTSDVQPRRLPGMHQSAPGSAGPAPREGYSPPPNIPSNCSRDVTSDLVRWLGTVPNDSTLVFASGACYRIDHTLRIANRSGLIFSGNGVTFSGKYHTEGKLPHIGVYASRNITFKNVIVRGANPKAGLREDAYVPSLQWEAAWDIEGSDGITLDAVRAYDLYGDFVMIQPLWARPPINSRNIRIKNSHFERNGRQGIAITGAVNVTINGNYIGKVRHSMLDLEPEWESLPIDNIRFTNNTTGGVYLLWIANAGKCNTGVSNIYVTDNVMASNAGVPLFHSFPPSGCAARGPFTIERNTLYVRQSPLAALDLTAVHDVMVRANKVYFEYWYEPRILVNLHQATRVSVLDNVVRADPRDTIIFVKADPGSDYISSGNQKI